MLQIMDPLALRLHTEARRAELRASMRASRGGSLRRGLGGWLVAIGERLAPKAEMRPAADRG